MTQPAERMRTEPRPKAANSHGSRAPASSRPKMQGMNSSQMPTGFSSLARRRYADILLLMKIRLFIDAKLASGEFLQLEKSQAHYLKNVLRAKAGRDVFVFNANDGEFRGEYTQDGQVKLAEQTIEPREEQPLTLILAPIKFGKIDFTVQKATELGVTRIQPVKTRFTSVTRINYDRLRANAMEAAEQSGRISFPQLDEMQALESVIDAWDPSHKIVFCDESLVSGGSGKPFKQVLDELPKDRKGFALLVGPEGGFAPDEAEFLRGKDFIYPASMGQRVLRAETAVVAGLGAFQAISGDWN